MGLYLGNDFADAYSSVYHRECFAEFRDAGFDQEGTDPFSEASTAMWNEEDRFRWTHGLQKPSQWPLWLRGHTALGRLLDRTSTKLSWGAGFYFDVSSAWAAEHPELAVAWTRKGNETTARIKYRLIGLDQQDPRIREGLRLTVLFLDRMAEAAQNHGSDLMLLAIPTKARVLSDLLREQDRSLHPDHDRLVSMEDRARETLSTWCGRRRIQLIDPLLALQAAMRQGVPVFPPSTDGHFSPAGYRILSAEVSRGLTRAH